MKTKVVGGLEWQEVVPEERFGWDEAHGYAARLGSGWRLPDIRELLGLVDYEKAVWSITPGDWNRGTVCPVFLDTPRERFWSSTPSCDPESFGYTVDFDNGRLSQARDGRSDDPKNRVRCVRSVDAGAPAAASDSSSMLIPARGSLHESGSLEWMVGTAVGTDGEPDWYGWEDAQAKVAELGNGWRMPTAAEILSIVDFSREGPPCSLFPSLPKRYYWTRTGCLCGKRGSRWLVSFCDYAELIPSSDAARPDGEVVALLLCVRQRSWRA
jgi:hypothetical protein